jgi:hypothetical protein
MKRDSEPDPHVTLKIPRPLYLRLKQVIQESGFHSVTEFVVYVLRDLVSSHERLEQVSGLRQPTETETPDVEPLNPEEIEAVRKRLQSLGYL